MSLRVNVDKRDIEKLARNLKETARVHLGKELDRAMLDAGEAVGHGIRDATDIYMPRGYEAVFRRSLVIKTELHHRGGLRTVTLTGRAFGRRGNPRQVENLEKGLLRHPVFSSDRKRWAKLPQRIRPGWMSEPARFATPAAVRKLEQAAERIGRHITKL